MPTPTTAPQTQRHDIRKRRITAAVEFSSPSRQQIVTREHWVSIRRGAASQDRSVQAPFTLWTVGIGAYPDAILPAERNRPADYRFSWLPRSTNTKSFVEFQVVRPRDPNLGAARMVSTTRSDSPNQLHFRHENARLASKARSTSREWPEPDGKQTELAEVGSSRAPIEHSSAGKAETAVSQIHDLQALDGGALIHRTCPMCGTQSGPQHVKVRAPIRAESLNDDEREAFWRGFRSRSCFFDFAQCPRCNLLYCPTYFSEASLDRLYSSMPDNTAGASPDVLRGTQQGYIDFLAAQGALRGTYLEIGPDIGLATEAACSTGGIDRFVLIEPNRAVHEQLQSATGNVPTTIAASLDALETPAEANNAVLVHVLDHLIDPLRYLTELRRHLAPGAHLLIVVHSHASLLRRVLGVRWPPFCLQHPQLFSPETLEAMLVSAGFRVMASSPTKNVLPLRHLVKTAASLVGIGASWTDRMPNIPIRVRLGNIMVVASS